MTSRPVAAMNEAVAREIVRQANGDSSAIAVMLAREIVDRGGWKPNTCKPLIRAFELATGVSR